MVHQTTSAAHDNIICNRRFGKEQLPQFDVCSWSRYSEDIWWKAYSRCLKRV